MIKISFLIFMFCLGNIPLMADQIPSADADFMEKLTVIKDPFEDGIPKPVIVMPKPVYQIQEAPKPVYVEPPKPKPKPVIVPQPIVILPTLNLQGVMVGGDMNEAIINDQIVPLQGSILGAKVISVSKKGVILLYKGKKFLLKVD